MPQKSEKTPFYASGLRFSCERCSGCCRYDSGYVFLSRKDTTRMAAALNMGCEEFAGIFCRWISVGNGLAHLSLKEKSNFDCVLWTINAGEGGGCSVYNERPLQCRAFPFWPSMLASRESWEAAAGDCPGMGKGSFYSYNSINNLINEWQAMRKNEPIMSRRV